MRRFFDEDAREATRRGDDGNSEVTLGSGVLLIVFFGLVLLCGLCFGLGYVVGSHGSKGPVFQSQPPAAGPSAQPSTNSQQDKPSAAAQPPQAPDQPGQPVAGAPGAVTVQTAAQGQEPASSTALGATPIRQEVNPSNSGWHPVQPALSDDAGDPQTAPPTAENQVRPAMPGQGTLMVQIAALSNQQDADVLVAALRRRGYAVSALRYPADRLIHVCVGPFGNRTDANSMKLKLQSDGYNAQVVP